MRISQCIAIFLRENGGLHPFCNWFQVWKSVLQLISSLKAWTNRFFQSYDNPDGVALEESQEPLPHKEVRACMPCLLLCSFHLTENVLTYVMREHFSFQHNVVSQHFCWKHAAEQRKGAHEYYIDGGNFSLRIFSECSRGPLKTMWRATCGPRAANCPPLT